MDYINSCGSRLRGVGQLEGLQRQGGKKTRMDTNLHEWGEDKMHSEDTKNAEREMKAINHEWTLIFTNGGREKMQRGQFTNIAMGAFVVMPNRMHGIIVIHDPVVGVTHNECYEVLSGEPFGSNETGDIDGGSPGGRGPRSASSCSSGCCRAGRGWYGSWGFLRLDWCCGTIVM
jgi:hypothetical protein